MEVRYSIPNNGRDGSVPGTWKHEIIRTTELKRELLQGLIEGRLKILDVLAGGNWIWSISNGRYQCQTLGFEHINMNKEEYEQFILQGGFHFIEEKTYE